MYKPKTKQINKLFGTKKKTYKIKSLYGVKNQKSTGMDHEKLKIDGLLVSHCKNQKWGSYETDEQFKLMELSENHNFQIALRSCRIQDK